MGTYTFEDTLTGSSVTCGFPQSDAVMVQGAAEPSRSDSLFFPGCSFINFGLPLVESVYETLTAAGVVDGISLLCCGKILSYEPNGDSIRVSFEEQLRDSMVASGVRRIVAACPNCVKALRSALAADQRTAGIEIDVLPVTFADLGYRIDVDTAARILSEATGVDAADVRVCIHDSCPDRETGEFADGLRALMPSELVVQGHHERRRSLCCGSILRANGKAQAADALAFKHGEDARGLGVSAIVTACASCAFQLTVAQSAVSVFHYLELLYDWRIPWEYAESYMKLRFLFDEALGVTVDNGGSRAFMALDVDSGVEARP